MIGEPEGGFFWLRSGGRKERLPTNAKLYHATAPLLLRTAGLVFHFLLRIRYRRWMVAVVSGRATSQKSESCEEYRCYDFRNCPVCHLLAYAYFVLILQSKIGRNRGSKIVLIDGSRLAELMIEFSVAVATDTTYTVKRIDNDFFESI
jgi:hypothetical protein